MLAIFSAVSGGTAETTFALRQIRRARAMTNGSNSAAVSAMPMATNSPGGPFAHSLRGGSSTIAPGTEAAWASCPSVSAISIETLAIA